MDFNIIGRAVAERFAAMSKHTLYRTVFTTKGGDEESRRILAKQTLWENYLAAFPAGSNPIYKERTEHDCVCCKQFVRALGGVVAIVDGAVQTIWDVSVDEPAYQAVADHMAALVRRGVIDNLFLHTEKSVGTAKTFQQLASFYPSEEGSAGTEKLRTITWSHYHANLPAACVAKKDAIGPRLSEARSTHDVFKRGLEELTLDAVDTALELVAQGSLYRGEEHKGALMGFRMLKKAYDALPLFHRPVQADQRDLFAWSASAGAVAVARVRNTAVGTLLQDLSGTTKECSIEGCACHKGAYKHVVPPLGLEEAVARFEKVMAPANYKRPTALVTKAMVAKAQAAIEELGYTTALERRYAVAEDVAASEVLFSDRTTKLKAATLAARAFEELAQKLPEDAKNYGKVEEVSVEKFLADVLPKAATLEVLLENRHAGNLVSLVAPVDPTAALLFKWPNAFSWSYAGDAADSMRERVAALGGRVDGALRFTHSWNHPDAGRNASLMDLHVFMPGSSPHKDEPCREAYPSGQRVGWNHRSDHASGAKQDVDYTAAAPAGHVPIENIAFPSLARMRDGVYTFKIHNWNLRPPTTSGFRAEIEFAGQLFQYDHPQPLRHHEWVTLAEVTLKDGSFSIEHKHPHGAQSRELWGLQTQGFHKVKLVSLSPNYWCGEGAPSRPGGVFSSGIGNKHWFFMLENCVNADGARPFYNEFFKSELEPHRKTMEMVGAKLRTEGSDRQLSGLGFSSTKRDSLTVRVRGTFNRVVKVVF